jgi:hypothetical protein
MATYQIDLPAPVARKVALWPDATYDDTLNSIQRSLIAP